MKDLLKEVDEITSKTYTNTYELITDLITITYMLKINIVVDYRKSIDTHFVYITNKTDTYVHEITKIYDLDSWKEVIKLVFALQRNYNMKVYKLDATFLYLIKGYTDTFVTKLESKTDTFSIINL